MAFGPDLLRRPSGANGVCNRHPDTYAFLREQVLQCLQFSGVQQRCGVNTGGPGQIVQGLVVDLGDGDGLQLQIGCAVALLQVGWEVVHATVDAAGSFGLFGGEPHQSQGCQVRIIVNEFPRPNATPCPVRSRTGLPRAIGF